MKEQIQEQKDKIGTLNEKILSGEKKMEDIQVSSDKEKKLKLKQI